jgi:hypothetical protein
MSLINELEDMTLKMSPRFMRNVRDSLEIALEEKTPARLEDVKANLSDFIEAVKIMGLDELRTKLEELAKTLTAPGPIAKTLLQFRSEFNDFSDGVPSEEREFLKKKEIPWEAMDVSVDQAVIDQFMAIPGVGEERARALYFSGFKSVEELASASVATLFGVPGMNLSVAKKIADYFNPNRLVRMDVFPREEETSSKAEIPFSGRPRIAHDVALAVTDEIEPGEDAKLIELFLTRLTEYLESASAIVESLSSKSFSSEIILQLQEITEGLTKAARYMGFEHIQFVTERMGLTVKDIISGDDDLDRDTIFALTESLKQLDAGCANLKRGAEKVKDRTEESTVSLEYNILTMAQYWGELFDLYKDTHEILRRVSVQGAFSSDDIQQLRKNTSRLDEMAGSISELVENII